jgi:hypothetical protein
MKALHFSIWFFALSVAILAQSDPVPFVSQPLVPGSAQPGGPDFTITINGAGFAPAAAVLWNGTPLPTTFISSTQLRADVSASDIAKAGSGSVSVINPGPGSGRSNTLPFIITKPLFPYFSRTSMEVAPRARSLAAADFNNDGKPDIVTASRSCVMDVLMNNGDGTFRYAYGASEWCPGWKAAVSPFVTGDFDNNGNLDAAAVVNGSVWEFLGDGTGGFSLKTHPTGTAWALADADFNSDGILDLAVGMKNKWEAHDVLLGNGDGSFSTGPFWYGGRKPMSLVTGDFNRDGKLDLAIIPDPDLNQVCILLGNQDATFNPGPCTLVGAGPRSLASADLNGDEITDLVVGNRDSGSISVLLGNGDGTFGTSYEYKGAAKFAPTSVAIGDLDGDGKLDLAIASRGAAKVILLFGNGEGTFVPNPGDDPLAACEESVVIADFNGDGRPDLATTGDDKLYVLWQSPLIHLPSSYHYPAVEVGDEWWDLFEMDNAGSTEVLITNFQVVGADSGSFYLEDICQGILAPNKSCAVSLWFVPRHTGRIHAVLHVEYQAPGMKPQWRDINLWGRGKEPRYPD